jgi:RecA-family ATPase
MTAAMPLPADTEQIAAFIDALFRYADEDTFASLRAFYDDREGVFAIKGCRITADAAPLVEAATRLANRCAAAGEPVVFSPPIATFSDPHSATEQSLANGLALSVECDKAPAAARAKLESLIGPATVIVASGGEWADPATGEVQAKLHLHWRLNEPTRDAASHAALKLARTLATRLVGGDASNKPIVHPLRWPGSWHRKGLPRLAGIVSKTDRELDLQMALERLEEAAGVLPPESASTASSGASVGEERQTAELVRAVLTAEDYHAPLVALAMRYLKGGMADAQIVLTLQGFMLAVPESIRDMKDGTIQPGRWQARYDDIPRAVRTAREKQPAPERPELRLIDPTKLHGVPVPERRWIVRDWLPFGHVTLFYGDGGVGKTLLAQQLLTSCATGRPWCGLVVKQCRVFGFFCEDDADEIHRRQAAILDAYGLNFADLADMRYVTGVGEDNLLVTFDRDNRAELTPRFHRLVEEARTFKAEVVLIDTAADTFGGNENDRSHVRQFVGHALNRFAREIGGAVLVNAHPSRSGMSAAGDLDGGSTGWSNSARSRWSLTRPIGEDGKEDKASQERVLTRRKANYAAAGETIQLRWSNGVLVPATAGSNPFAAVSKQMDRERVFLDLLAKCDAANMPVNESKKAGNWAPRVFAKRPDAGGHTVKDFDMAMSALFAAGRIRLETYGRKSDERRRIVAVQEGQHVIDEAA